MRKYNNDLVYCIRRMDYAVIKTRRNELRSRRLFSNLVMAANSYSDMQACKRYAPWMYANH
jgi:hypothetical protein